jgi:predicted kinase
MWCLDAARRRMMNGKSVIVSNTFTRWREMREYVDIADECSLNVEIITCLGDFGSIHDVPAETMARMRERFIPNEGLPQERGIKYSEHIPVARF